MDYREEFSSLFVKQEEHTLRGTLRNLAPRVLPFKVIESDTDDFLLTLIPATGGKNTPSPFLPLYLQNGKRYSDALLRHCSGLRRLFIAYKLLSHRCRKCEPETGSTF